MIHVGQLFLVFFLPVRTSVTCAVMFCACPTSTWLVAWSSKWWSQTAWPLECWVTQIGYLSGNSEYRQTTFNPCRYYETCCESIHVNQSKTCERCLPAKETTIKNKHARSLGRLFVWSVIVCMHGTNCTLESVSVCTYLLLVTTHNTTTTTTPCMHHQQRNSIAQTRIQTRLLSRSITGFIDSNAEQVHINRVWWNFVLITTRVATWSRVLAHDVSREVLVSNFGWSF